MQALKYVSSILFSLTLSVLSFSVYADDVCGDGNVGVSEQCDDGGVQDGDGCSAVCQVEANWQCAGSPSTCTFNSPCTAGNYWDGAACTPATAGHYVPDAGAIEQKSCATGSYQPATQSTSCIAASANFYVDVPAATAQTPCPAGMASAASASVCNWPSLPLYSNFVSGQPAVAADMNDRFTTLVNKVNQLQTQLDALQAYAGQPTVASLAGTYNITELSTENRNDSPGSYSSQSETGVGTVTLNADGSGSVNSTNRSTQLAFSSSPVTALTGLNVQNGSFITGVYPATGTVQGQQVVTSVGTSANTAVSGIIQSTYDIPNVNISIYSDTTPENSAFTWSLSGNVVTINAESPINFTVAGRVMVAASPDELGNPGGITILVRQ